MSKQIPTPYMWSYQPQSGRAAGASVDYSTRMNWLSAGPSMIGQVNDIRHTRNQILIRQALISETPRPVQNPPSWPARLLPQMTQPPTHLHLPRNEILEGRLTDAGMQLAGGGALAPRDLYALTVRGRGIQLNEDLPFSASTLRPDGIFQLGGGGRSSFNPTEAYLTLQNSSSLPRSGGIGSDQFVREFVPTVYINPFSGPPGTYPDQFISNYNILTDSVAGYD